MLRGDLMNLSKDKYVSVSEAQAVCHETIPYLDEIARFELVSYMLGIRTAFEVREREERKLVRKELNLEFPFEKVKTEVKL